MWDSIFIVHAGYGLSTQLVFITEINYCALVVLVRLKIVCDIQQIVSTTLLEWRVIPDIIGDGVSEQVEIMTAICETKGATFDGTDCVGELDDSTVHVSKQHDTTLLAMSILHSRAQHLSRVLPIAPSNASHC